VNFDVTVNGRPWRVAIEPADRPGRVQVSVKGRRRVFDAAWVDAETLSLIGVDQAARVFDVGVRPTHGGELEIVIDARGFRALAAVEGRSSHRARRDRVSAALEGRQPVVSPMPGRVVRVLVAAGDRVIAGQGIVVVEAMKMENELRSPKDGVVREMNVSEGAAIDADAVLVVIE
jgi:biotin carboxyl carrier protein